MAILTDLSGNTLVDEHSNPLTDDLPSSPPPPPPPPRHSTLKGARGYALPHVSRRLRTFHRSKRRIVFVPSAPSVPKVTTWTGKLTDQSGVTMNIAITLST